MASAQEISPFVVRRPGRGSREILRLSLPELGDHVAQFDVGYIVANGTER